MRKAVAKQAQNGAWLTGRCEFMQANGAAKQEPKQQASVSHMVEDVVGCKWTMAVLGQVRKGIHRPGAIERAIPGLTTKVLNERLRKLLRFGLLAREVFPETPPRVEYLLTEFGARFVGILDMIDALQNDLSAGNAEHNEKQHAPGRGPAGDVKRSSGAKPQTRKSFLS